MRAARAVGATVLVALAAVGCGGKPASPPKPPPVTLHLEKACDLVPGAGLTWLVEAKPRALAQDPELIPAIAALVPEARFGAYAASHGGVDPRQVEDLCVARFKASTLVSARVRFDPARVETAFAERATTPPKRTILVADPPVVRLEGVVLGETQNLTLFGREAVATEAGPLGALRAAEAFASGKLKRSSPALASRALAPVVAALGDAPVRVLVPGPFEGELGRGLGGLLRAATAFGLSARRVDPGPRLAIRLVVGGAWGEDAAPAAERLAAAVHVLSASALGRVLGLDPPLEGPVSRVLPDALVLEATVDADRLARGAHGVLEGDITDLLRR